MYLQFYELDKYPFKTNPDPSFIWFGEKHKEALALLTYGILERVGFLLLIGDVGTGKTSLIRYLFKLIDSSVLVATMHDPDMPTIDFYNYLAEEFKMNKVLLTRPIF
jgi:general secretion pathway protein A